MKSEKIPAERDVKRGDIIILEHRVFMYGFATPLEITNETYLLLQYRKCDIFDDVMLTGVEIDVHRRTDASQHRHIQIIGPDRPEPFWIKVSADSICKIA